MTVRLAADIGGTFTDVVAEVSGRRRAAKVPTTPDAPEEAVLDGAERVLEAAGLGWGDVSAFVHGATLATNAILERRGARTALIATEGFRDVLEIADEGRFDQYDLDIVLPEPLVRRDRRLTVPERVDVTGAVRVPLDEGAVREAARRLAGDGTQAVAVAFLHAYANPAHEERARALIEEEAPGLAVSISSEVCPEIREWERTSTTVANAYVQPLMAGYLGRLGDAIGERGCPAALWLMTSGGRLTGVETARRFPIRLVESGPAGGAIMAARIARERGERRVLSFDMGGTTAKICFVEDGEPLTSHRFEVDRSARFQKGSGLPLRIPVVEMIEIGAGGGSVARLDATRSIAVGPRSAGSVPGPACYDRGGTDPTVTDADVALGRIRPEGFAGGAIALAPDRATEALSRVIGGPSNLAPEMAALGVLEIVDEAMANAARVHAAERGVALSGQTMVAFGGAAPLHAARMAEKLGLTRIVVPADAGVGSAVGFLRAQVSFELVRSLFVRLDAFDPGAVSGLLEAMSEEARALAGEGGQESRAVFMRYTGQGHEIRIPLESLDPEALRAAFEAEYRRQFDRHIPGAAIEALSWSVAVGAPEEPVEALPPTGDAPAPRPIDHRAVFDGRSHAPTPVYARADLSPGARVPGPALIVEEATSTYLTAAFAARMDAGGALILERAA